MTVPLDNLGPEDEPYVAQRQKRGFVCWHEEDDLNYDRTGGSDLNSE
jgi:hypothetical protein